MIRFSDNLKTKRFCSDFRHMTSLDHFRYNKICFYIKRSSLVSQVGSFEFGTVCYPNYFVLFSDSIWKWDEMVWILDFSSVWNLNADSPFFWHFPDFGSSDFGALLYIANADCVPTFPKNVPFINAVIKTCFSKQVSLVVGKMEWYLISLENIASI